MKNRFRIGSRGNCQSLMSDVSALELYALNNVNTSPFQTIKAVKKVLRRERG